MLQINVANLKRSPGGTVHYEQLAELPPLEMHGQEYSFSGPVKASLDAINTGTSLVVQGMAAGILNLTCSRCLEEYPLPFEVDVAETYVSAVQEGGEDAIPFSGDLIDLTPEVFKSIILAMPMKPVCRDECAGLCLTCGREQNNSPCDCAGEELDHRLSILKKLIKD